MLEAAIETGYAVGYDETARISWSDPYELGRDRMIDLFRSFAPVFLRDLIGNPNLREHVPYGFAVPKKHRNLIGTGTTGLIFQLPDTFCAWDFSKSQSIGQVNLVAKASFYSLNNSLPGAYILSARPAGIPQTPDESLKKTMACLRKMGFKFPPIIEHHAEIKGKFVYFTIMPDLRKTEGIRVQSADGFDFSQIRNGARLRQLFQNRWQHILQQHKKGKFKVRAEHHSSPLDLDGKIDPSEAIRKIFQVQYLPGAYGKLFPWDLDHLTIRESNVA